MFFSPARTLLLIILTASIPIFFTAMSSLIVQKVSPIYERISDNRTNAPSDAAIYYKGSQGELQYRLCNRSVRWFCLECSEGDDDDTVQDPSVANAPSKNNNNNNSNHHDSRRINARRPDRECICGVSIKWDDCPFVSDPALIFQDGSSSCQDFFDNLKLINDLNLAWAIIGMIIPVICIPIICVFLIRDRIPDEKVVFVIVGPIGLIVFGSLFAILIVLVIATEASFTTRGGDDPTTFTPKNSCGSESLYEQTFRDKSNFDMWQAAIAGVTFTGIVAVPCLIYTFIAVYLLLGHCRYRYKECKRNNKNEKQPPKRDPAPVDADVELSGENNAPYKDENAVGEGDDTKAPFESYNFAVPVYSSST